MRDFLSINTFLQVLCITSHVEMSNGSNEIMPHKSSKHVKRLNRSLIIYLNNYKRRP